MHTGIQTDPHADAHTETGTHTCGPTKGMTMSIRAWHGVHTAADKGLRRKHTVLAPESRGVEEDSDKLKAIQPTSEEVPKWEQAPQLLPTPPTK